MWTSSAWGLRWSSGESLHYCAFAIKRFWTPFSRPFRDRFGPFFGVLVPVSGILGARQRRRRKNGEKRRKMGEKWPKESGSNDGLTANAEYSADDESVLTGLVQTGFCRTCCSSSGGVPSPSATVLSTTTLRGHHTTAKGAVAASCSNAAGSAPATIIR